PRKPSPINMPMRPAPSRPPSSPPASPRPKPPNRPPGWDTGGRAAVVVAPGCVIERVIGAAVVGAVAVGGGAEKVFEPREPKFARGRASTSVITMVKTAATAKTASNGRSSFIYISQSPGGHPEYRGWEP